MSRHLLCNELAFFGSDVCVGFDRRRRLYTRRRDLKASLVEYSAVDVKAKYPTLEKAEILSNDFYALRQVLLRAPPSLSFFII